MAAKFVCANCAHTLTSRHDELQPRHRCPKCGKQTLQPVK